MICACYFIILNGLAVVLPTMNGRLGFSNLDGG
jgi:hypothetical protein